MMSQDRQPNPNDLLRDLSLIVGDEHVSDKHADLDQHSSDQSFHEPHLPTAVVWPEDTSQVASLLMYANAHHLPVTAWGAGSSLEGNPIPVYAGIVIDLKRMDKIINIRSDDFQVDVQAGMLYKDLNAKLGRHGLFFAPDPGANASIGGMIANNAAGTRTPRYGATKDNVLRLEVVLASGEIIQVGTRAQKSSSGYDLVHLFVGSEGTLGVITQATLKLAPLPQHFGTMIASFPAIVNATHAIAAIKGSGTIPAALELLGENVVQALNESGEFILPEAPTLLVELHGASNAGLQEEMDQIEAICKTEGCETFQAGLGREERSRLWSVRHKTYEILVRANPQKAFLIADAAVAVSDYPKLVEAADSIFEKNGIKGYLVGHAGDGNLHPLIPYHPGDDESYGLANKVQEEITRTALAMGGTATGEHGIGLGKRRFMEAEHGSSLQVMRAIKKALDPNGILNPGKVLPDD